MALVAIAATRRNATLMVVWMGLLQDVGLNSVDRMCDVLRLKDLHKDQCDEIRTIEAFATIGVRRSTSWLFL